MQRLTSSRSRRSLSASPPSVVIFEKVINPSRTGKRRGCTSRLRSSHRVNEWVDLRPKKILDERRFGCYLPPRTQRSYSPRPLTNEVRRCTPHDPFTDEVGEFLRNPSGWIAAYAARLPHLKLACPDWSRFSFSLETASHHTQHLSRGTQFRPGHPCLQTALVPGGARRSFTSRRDAAKEEICSTS